MSIKTRIDRLFKELNADKIPIELENNETLYLEQEDVLSLTVEAIKNAAVIDNNGQTISQPIDEKDLSELARKLRKAKTGELDKLPSLIGGLFYEN